ncbi:MAG: hypothetical protein RMJ19_03270 [Gemmatales bacterium]|nr:hypothetical protein [Gemmatales bacterium]MDW8174669.1 hypothetical protein [Gemmatales bacterium]
MKRGAVLEVNLFASEVVPYSPTAQLKTSAEAQDFVEAPFRVLDALPVCLALQDQLNQTLTCAPVVADFF